ncbi:MAG: cadherin domain-containing protein [Gammaproteobacteria bacterium]|nr:cadherin domain-containing protein [Gammaproteobacteria bacterium]
MELKGYFDSSTAEPFVNFVIRMIVSLVLLASVTAVQAAPVLTMGAGSTTFVEDGAAVAIDPSLIIAEPNSTAFNGATVAITVGYVSTEDQLVYSTTAGISGTFNSATGVLTLTGSATPDNYQAALRAVQYRNTNTANPDTGTRTIRYALGSSLSFSDNGHFYEFVTASGISWTDARDAAAASTLFGLQGYLTTVTSANENTFVASKLAGQGWMGANDASVENDWRWVTGPEAGTAFWSGVANGSSVGGMYNNWSSGEPNQWGGDEDYAHFLNGGAWNDYPLSLSSISGYVVEYGGMAGDPTLQITGNKNVNVTAQNDAPSFSAGATLAAVNEDTLSPVGATVTALLNGNFNDVDSSSNLSGIAVAADTSVSGVQGDWEYSTDSGSNWFDMGSVSTASALLLNNSTLLRFKPFSNYSGTPGSLTVFAVDESGSTTYTSSATRQAFDTTSDDTASQIAASGVAIGTSVTAVNDAPILTAFSAVIDSTNEDTEVELTLAELQAQGDETDSEDGTVSRFVIKSVSTGSLKIGTSAGTATTFAATSNDTIDASNNAYWTPVSNANGSLNAFAAVVKDSSNAESISAVQALIMVTATNDTPTLTVFSAAIDSTNEDTEVELTLAELQAQGDEADSEDGTVSRFVIKSVSTGSLKIGASAGTAMPFAATSNDTIDASNNAYWTPANDANGSLSAFTVAAEDSSNTESISAVQALIMVTAVNDIPTLTAFSSVIDSSVGGAEVELTLAEFQAQGDEADIEDGTISRFVIKAVSSGSLKIGTSPGTASVFATSSNDTVNATNNAYWTPANNASGEVNAFTVVAQDSDSAESISAIQARVSVSSLPLVVYDFEDNVNDASGNGNHGVLQDTITYDSAGHSGKALSLSGSGYVKLPDDLLRNNQDFTVSLWFKTTSTGGILGYQNKVVGATATYWVPIISINTLGKLQAELWIGSSMLITSTNAVNDGQWHRVVMTADTTNNILSVYLDGVAIGSATGTIQHLDMSFNQLGLNDARGRVGIDLPNTETNYFTGLLDEFTFYSNALSAVEVAKTSQSISFPAIADQLLSQATLNLAATASSALGVTYTSTTVSVCTVAASTVTLLSTGTCTIQANQAGDTTYSSAAQITRSFDVVDNFPPVLTMSGGNTVFVEDGVAVAIDPSLTIVEPSAGAISGATVAITAGYVSTEDQLVYSAVAGAVISGSFNSTTGILTLTGSATPDDYQAALRAVQYQNINTANPDTGARTIRYALGSSLSFAENGHFYEFVTASGISWTAAKDAAAARTLFGLQGYLTTVTSANENAFIASKLAGQGWMGASDAAVEGDWRWVTGPETGTAFWSGLGNGSSVGSEYENWGGVEPNNAGGEDYAHFLSGATWNDYPHQLGNISGYVVEYGGMAGDPALQITGNKTVNVTAQNDAPEITSDGGGVTAALNALENQTAVTTLTSTDAENHTVTYSLTGGADQASFSLVNGVLSFLTSSDFEAPTDSDVNNSYVVEVTATDNGSGALTDTQTLTVSVTNVNEFPIAGAVTANNVSQNDKGNTSYTFTVAYSDVDGNFDSATVDTADVTVSGGASVSGASWGGNGSTGIATYTVTPPGGSWDDSDNGTYTIAILANQVTDTNTGFVAANASAASFTVLMDSTGPTVTAVTLPNSAMKVGDVVVVSITASEAGSTLLSGLVNGVAVTGFMDNGGGSYSATYTILDGHSDRAAGDAIPVSFQLQDSAGNVGNTYTNAIVQTADAIDANNPNGATGALAVNENASNGTTVGTVLATGASIYSLVDDAGGRFAIHASTGVVTVLDGSLLDYEASVSHNLTVRAVDAASNAIDTVLTVMVNPVNEAPLVAGLNGDNVRFNVGGSAVNLDDDLDATLTMVDSIDMDGGNVTVAIVANAQTAEDVLQVGAVGNISLTNSDVFHSDGLIIATVAGGTNGENLVLTLNANASFDRVRDLVSALQYAGSDDLSVNTATRTVRITLDDGDGESSTTLNQEVSVVVVRAPIIDLDGDDGSGNSSGGFNASFTEGGGVVALADSDDSVAEANDTVITDDGNFKSLSVVLDNRPDGNAEGLSSSYGTGVQEVNGESVTISAYDSATGELLMTVDDNAATAETMELLIESLRYDSNSQTPDTTERLIRFIATDDDDNVGLAVTASLVIVAVNDAPTGSVSVTGALIEGQTLVSDISTVVDLDGLLAFSYQWQRDGVDISGATGASYLLMAADVGGVMTLVVSYTDAGGYTESLNSVASAVVDGDLDGDGLGDLTDTDIDGDGLSNAYEVANGLDSRDSSDRDADTDNDGVSNYDEFVAGTDASADDNPPTLSAPADITLNAMGLYTAVDLGGASASDATDGELTARITHLNGEAVLVTPTHFSPGAHVITWTASDEAGNSVSATQNVNVVPLVELSKNQITTEGATARFKVVLNGSAVDYPVIVPYSVSGTAATDGSDHDLVDGSVTINSPDLEATVSFALVDDGAGEGMETLLVTMGTPSNAALGSKDSHSVDIYEGNVAPSVLLTAEQGYGVTRLVAQTGGLVVVAAAVSDANVDDLHGYDWSATDNVLVDTDSDDAMFSFDPASLATGVYTLKVVVNDGLNTVATRLELKVVASLPALSVIDSDGDGVDDATEGYGDTDGDGVPNYLDNSNIAKNVAQQLVGDIEMFLMETESDLVLSLGSIAFSSGSSQIGVSDSEIEQYGNDGVGGVVDEHHDFNSGLFDFNIEALPVPGQSVSVVVVQYAPIPASAVYRKLMPSGWQDFVENSRNHISSTQGVEGYCPPPGDSRFSPGLTQGHWCVQLTIEDGGPNDADGLANQTVKDPGGVAVLSSTPITVKVTGSGGGSVSLWTLFLMGLVVVVTRLSGRGRRLVLAICCAVSGLGVANAQSPLKPDYIGISYLSATSDERASDFQSDIDALGLTASVTQTDLSRSAWSGHIGYQIEKPLALEIGYVDLGKSSTSLNGLAADVDHFITSVEAVYPVTGSGFTFNFVGRIALSNKVDAWANFGVFLWQAEYDLSSETVSKTFKERGFNNTLGFGLEMDVVAQVPIRLGWTMYRLGGVDVSAWTLGAGFRF